LADTPLEISAPALAPHEPPAPSRFGRWLLALALFGAYFAVQIVVAIPFIAWLMITKPNLDQADLGNEPLVVWATLIGAGVAAGTTAVVAWAWPSVWKFLSQQEPFTQAEWIGWATPRHIPLWLVGALTLPIVFAITFGVQAAVGPSEVAVQQALFTSPLRQIVASLVVATVVPLAEELIFRGALYKALLIARPVASMKWTDHILPVAITTVLFALVHGLAGFDSLPPFLAIGGLALYLGVMRAITGSVKSAIVGHVVWNLIGAVALTLSNYLPLQ